MGSCHMVFRHLTNWLSTNKSSLLHQFPFLYCILFFPPVEKTYSIFRIRLKHFLCNVPLWSVTMFFAYMEIQTSHRKTHICNLSKRCFSSHLVQILFFNITTISGITRDDPPSEWMNKWKNASLKFRSLPQIVYNGDRHRCNYFLLFFQWAAHRYYHKVSSMYATPWERMQNSLSAKNYLKYVENTN